MAECGQKRTLTGLALQFRKPILRSIARFGDAFLWGTRQNRPLSRGCDTSLSRLCLNFRMREGEIAHVKQGAAWRRNLFVAAALVVCFVVAGKLFKGYRTDAERF